jgi:hypothetical protein
MYSRNGINWASGTTAGVAGYQWHGLTYGNGLFVSTAFAGTAGSRVMTSPDGLNWTIRTTPADILWYGVGYGIPSTGPFSGKGLFVAVSYNGTGNRVMTSPDGFTWTIRVTLVDIGLCSVAFGNGYFVATGETGPTGIRAMISTDGINFIAKTTPDQSFFNVTYGTPSSGLYTGQGIFVGVSITGTGNRVMTANFIDTYTTNSLAIGNGAVANGNNSSAIGAGAIASGSNQIVLGTSNETISIPGSLKLKSTQSIKGIATGTSGLGTTSGTINFIDFGATFSSPPIVIANINYTGTVTVIFSVFIINVTSTSFFYRKYFANYSAGTNGAATEAFDWIAIEK